MRGIYDSADFPGIVPHHHQSHRTPSSPFSLSLTAAPLRANPAEVWRHLSRIRRIESTGEDSRAREGYLPSAPRRCTARKDASSAVWQVLCLVFSNPSHSPYSRELVQPARLVAHIAARASGTTLPCISTFTPEMCPFGNPDIGPWLELLNYKARFLMWLRLWMDRRGVPRLGMSLLGVCYAALRGHT